MIENVMSKVGGTAIFGVLSISIFFLFFTGMLLWAAGLKKSYLHSMSDLPLDPQPNPKSNSNSAPEETHEQ